MRLKIVLIYTLIFYLFFIPGITVSTKISYAVLSDVIIQRGALAIILLILLTHLFFKKEGEFKLYVPLFIPILLVLVTTCLSIIGNNVTLPGLILGLLDYLRYPLLAIALVGMPIKRYENLLRVFFLFTAIQLPIVIVQYLVSGHAGDENSGTMGFGTQGALAIIVTYWSYDVFIQDTNISKKGITVILMWAAAYAGDIELLYIMPFIIILMVYMAKRNYIRILIATLVFSTAVAFIYPILQDNPRALGRGFFYILRADDKSERFISGNGRLAHNIISFDLVLRDWRNVINGMGINAFYKGQAGIIAGNPLADSWTLYNNIKNDPYYREDYKLGPSQYMRVFGETGILGLFAHLCLLVSVWLISGKFKQYVTSKKEYRMYLSFRGIFFLYAVALTVYTDTWRLDFTSLPVWLYVSMMMTVIVQRSKQITPVAQIAPAYEYRGDLRPDATIS